MKPQLSPVPIQRSRATIALALALGFAVGAASTPALGGPKDRQDRREERRDDRQDRREERRDDQQDRREERRNDRQDRRQERRDDRQTRRADQRAELEKKWGDLLDRADVRGEVRKHARRVARIQRIHTLAEANKNDKLAQNAAALLEKEQSRHAQRMEKLKAEASK